MGIAQKKIWREVNLSPQERAGMTMECCLALFERVRGIKYGLYARCGKCKKTLTLGELLTGFSKNPEILTTKCPNCRKPLRAMMRYSNSEGSRAVAPFISPAQVLAFLRRNGSIAPGSLAGHFPSEYHSTLIHFGSIRAALGRIGLTYGHSEVVVKGGKEPIFPFLGCLPDARIAAITGFHVSTVRRWRTEEGIGPCSDEQLWDYREGDSIYL